VRKTDRRIALLGDSKLRGKDKKYAKKIMTNLIKSLRPDVVYVSICPGILFKMLSILEEIDCKTIMVLPSQEYLKVFNESELELFCEYADLLNGVILLNEVRDIKYNKDTMLTSQVPFLTEATNIRVVLASNFVVEGDLKNAVDKFKSAKDFKESTNIVVNYR